MLADQQKITFTCSVCVTYWPSTEPSIKRCTCVNKRKGGNRCIRSKISEYHLDLWTWLNSVQMRTSTGSRWMSNNYITRCHRRLESVQFEAVSSSRSWTQDAHGVRTSSRQRAWALSDPRLSSPTRMWKKCCYGQRNLGSICGSLSPSPTNLSYTRNINRFE